MLAASSRSCWAGTIAIGAMGWGNSTISSTQGAVDDDTTVYGWSATPALGLCSMLGSVRSQ